jgi:hypothetical protein
VFTLPAGGWYVGTVRYGAVGPEQREIHVEHLGIGEVFVGAGQSNSTNYGRDSQKPDWKGEHLRRDFVADRE